VLTLKQIKLDKAITKYATSSISGRNAWKVGSNKGQIVVVLSQENLEGKKTSELPQNTFVEEFAMILKFTYNESWDIHRPLDKATGKRQQAKG
jgi:hypothetical protein